MYVKKVDATISFDREELDCVAFSILHDMRTSVKDHYVNHEMHVFDDQTALKQRVGKDFFGILGMAGQWESEVAHMKKQIEEANQNNP